LPGRRSVGNVIDGYLLVVQRRVGDFGAGGGGTAFPPDEPVALLLGGRAAAVGIEIIRRKDAAMERVYFRLCRSVRVDSFSAFLR